MPGHISYPRTAAIANAWSNLHDAVVLVDAGATAAAIEALEAILADPTAPGEVKRKAAELLNRIQNRTYPTGEEGGCPSGIPKDLREGPEGKSDQAENECASFLASQGYRIEQLREKKGSKNPDYRIEDRIFDHYGPAGSSPENMIEVLGKKRSAAQADRFILDLSRSAISLQELDQALKAALGTPGHRIHGTKEIIIIRDGRIIRFYPSESDGI
jgi:hypothetical protein